MGKQGADLKCWSSASSTVSALFYGPTALPLSHSCPFTYFVLLATSKMWFDSLWLCLDLRTLWIQQPTLKAGSEKFRYLFQFSRDSTYFGSHAFVS